jgi:hypothetical protein
MNVVVLLVSIVKSKKKPDGINKLSFNVINNEKRRSKRQK